jgi:WD40 repeat protein
MKPSATLVLFACSLLLAACGATAQTPAPAVPAAPTDQPAPADTANPPAVDSLPTLTPTETRVLRPTVTVLPTRTPRPGPTSPYPFSFETPMPDLGVPVIALDTVAQLSPLYLIQKDKIWHSAASGDEQKLFVATTNGLFVYDRQGQQLAHWPSLFTHDLPGEPMLTVNRDGSRFALITRNAGKWEARLYYNVAGADPLLTFVLPLDGDFNNLQRILLSPDDRYLAYGAGDAPLRILDLETKTETFKQPAGIASLAFSPDGSLFAAQRGRELLVWKTSTWKNPASIVLPREDTPYVFALDSGSLILAQPAQLRIVSLETLKTTREIAIKAKSPVNWQVEFVDATTLRGVNVYWNDRRTSAALTLAEWNIETGDTLRLETSQTLTPDALSALWGVPIAASAPPSGVEFGPYLGLRFIGSDMLMVNAPHSACWTQLSTATRKCFEDPDHFVYAGDVGAYKEIRNNLSTVLQDWRGGTVLEAGAYHILAVTKNVDFALVNVNNVTTDLYAKDKTFPSESVAGVWQSLAENKTQLVFSTLETPIVTTLTLVDKETRVTLWQKKESFLLKPLVMTKEGVIYFLKYDPDYKKTIFMMINPAGWVGEVTRLDLASDTLVLTLSANGLLALGLQDGSVVLMTQDGSQNVAFQAARSPIEALTFSADGKYLGIASAEGLKVWGLEP